VGVGRGFGNDSAGFGRGVHVEVCAHVSLVGLECWWNDGLGLTRQACRTSRHLAYRLRRRE
jgi:hypothetical protein